MKRLLEKEFISWKKRKEHLPLLIRGARQVGKSYLIKHFGKTHFENLVVVDFEKREEFKLCFANKDPKEIIKKIETLTSKKIKPGKTLLFLDEIQHCKDALISLRYFKEEMKNLHVIAAGSLMEFLLNDENYSFPVGRIEFLYLRPFSFEEFLHTYKPIFIEKMKSFSLKSLPNEVEHKELLKLLKEYLFIGGMPSAINTFISTNSLLESQRVHNRILKAYESDLQTLLEYEPKSKIEDNAVYEMISSIRNSLSKGIGKNDSYTQKGIWNQVIPNIRIDSVGERLQIVGMVTNKRVIREGFYKKVNSSPKTLAKKAIKEALNLKAPRIRTFCLESANVNRIASNGDVLEIA